MDFYAKEVERMDRPRRASLEPSVVSRPPTGETEIPRSDQECEDHSSAREAERARGEPEQDLSGEIPIPSADETLTPPEIPAVSSGSTPSSSTSVPISLDASSSSGVKRAYSGSIALPNSPGVSSGSGVKRAHGESIVNGDEEQLGTRARISALIAGLHGVNAAEDDEICSGDGITYEWMVNEAKRTEMERFKWMKVYRVVTRESMERDEEEKMISIKWVITSKGTEEHLIAKASLVARKFNTGEKHGELFARAPGLMAMRTVISRAMTRCENGGEKINHAWLM